MIYNGTVQFATQMGGGLDENHDPIPVSIKWSNPQPCNIRPVRLNLLAIVDGNRYRDASYEVLTTIRSTGTQRIKLERQGVSFGEFEVISEEPLQYVGMLKLIV